MSIFRALSLGLLLCLPALTTAATDPAALQAEIDAKVAEIDALRRQLADEEQTAAAVQAELARLRGASAAFEERRRDALAAMQAQFERIIEDPTLDLAGAQRDYREAFEAQAAHAATVAAAERRLASGERRIATAREAAALAGEALAGLRAEVNRARFERLFRELNVTGEVTLTSSISCERDETIAGCIARGEEAAKALARTRFREQVLAAVTEADLLAGQWADTDATPTLLESTIRNSGFRGQGDYFVELSAQLRSEMDRAQACRLLGLTEAECRGDAATAEADAAAPDQPAGETPPEEPAPEELAEQPEDSAEPEPAAATGEQFRLTVRSNVYYDEVFIDGVAYGSTKLDVMLPPGEYDVEVRKPGHSIYRERIPLTDSRTVTATLYELGE
jgi:hypothetical protein